MVVIAAQAIKEKLLAVLESMATWSTVIEALERVYRNDAMVLTNLASDR